MNAYRTATKSPEFYRRYTPVIRAAGKGAGFNDAECGDLIQTVMLKFFSNARTFTYREGQVKFRTWFARIIRSSIVDQIRDASRQKNLDAEIPEQPDPKQVALILGVTVNQLYVAKNRCTAMLKKIVKHHNEADPEARIEL